MPRLKHKENGTSFLANRKVKIFSISTFLTHKSTREALRENIAAEKILYYFGERERLR